MGIIVNHPAGSIDFPQLLMQLDIIKTADQIKVPEHGEPMQVLASDLKESCSAAVLEGQDIVYVLRVPTHKIMRTSLGVGSRLPAAWTSMGRVLLASLFLLTAAIGLFISNTATAVLMAPIAIATANQIGASPYPFAMVVAVAASAAFMTPISSPVNTLVLGPGQYRFGDFVRIGVPFTLLVMFVCVLVIPWLFPL